MNKISVGRENTWNEIVKKGYRYIGNETGDNHANISCPSWAALPVAKTVPFWTFHTYNPKIYSTTRSTCILERNGGVFEPEGSKAHFNIILNISFLV